MRELKILKFTCLFIISSLLFLSCGTIVGGNLYNAHLTVVNHPKAEIYYKDKLIGTGRAKLSLMRTKANKLSFTIIENGCDTLKANFVSRSFRGGALAGTIFGWTGFYQGIILPWGIAVDFATGSLWKPNIIEKGISKINYKNYIYDIDYKGCEVK